MAKITVTGNAIVLTSSIKYADIEVAKKYRPGALKLTDKDGKELFAIDVGYKPQANEFGVVFNGKTHDEAGYATHTMLFDTCDDGDLKGKIADIYGEALIGLGKIEAEFGARVEEINKEREAVLAQIELA